MTWMVGGEFAPRAHQPRKAAWSLIQQPSGRGSVDGSLLGRRRRRKAGEGLSFVWVPCSRETRSIGNSSKRVPNHQGSKTMYR